MSKRDFELIARIVREMACSEVQRRQIAERFASALLEANSRFNRAKFIVACAPIPGK